ncbi:MAG: hypothetical protein IIY18_01075 [Clostridia bacterium]|nr:hypothetical protein [Clostridia bacterium]
MKKIFALILAVTMLLSTLALVGCGANNADDNASSEAVAEVDVVDALKNIWDNYEDENKFAAMGGGMANPVTDGPGELSLDDTAEVNDKTGVPEDKITTIDKAATLIHMMNANTFSAAAVHAAEGVKAEDVATTIGDNLKIRQWMCGIPEKHVIIKVGSNTIISAFGANDLITVFLDKAKVAYPEYTVLLEQTF